MQYFTFLGVPNGGKYKEVLYKFEDDSEPITLSEYIQDAVYDKYRNEIDEIVIFVTKEAKAMHEKYFVKKYNDIVKFVLIDYSISFEEFVDELLSRINENGEIIIDITYSYRNLPIKLTFAIKYIEMSKNVSINHLYYGRLNDKKEENDIIDFIQDYRLQYMSSLLYQFDKTLLIETGELSEQVGNDDKLIKFLDSLKSLNDLLEYSEFNRCTKTIREITERCRSILKEKEKYKLIIPLIEKINNKFEVFNLAKNEVNKKLEFIRILLAHGRYQIAITFTDQLFREELIRSTLEPNNMNFSLANWAQRNSFPYNEKTTYRLSQHLITNTYNLRGGDGYSENFNTMLNKYKQNIQATSAVSVKYKKDIKKFFSNIRNSVNHGTAIDKKDMIDQTIMGMLHCIDEFGKGEEG